MGIPALDYGKRRANGMMSQDSPNDLIETVTAEIEAIIQEEINSQNVAVIPEEPVAAAVSEPEQTVNEDKIEEYFEVETEELPVPVESTSEVIETAEESIKESQTEAIIENQVEISEPREEITKGSQPEALTENQIEADTTEAVVNEVKEDIVAEYTVQIGSPTQEKTAVPDLDENLAAVPLIETILKDAPIDENDGPRAKHFKQALRKALNNTVKSCSGEKLESCFPFNLKADQFSQINTTILNALKSVIDGVQEPFDDFLKSEKLVEKLNKVDEFTRSRVPGTSDASEAAVLASLTPQNLIDRKLYATKLASLSKLEQFAQKLEMENSQLSSKLNNRQTEFADRLDRLKSSQQLLDAALDQISTISMDDLEVLVDKMNHQYQPSPLKFQN